MAVKILNPVTAGTYTDYTVTGAATAVVALSDTNHYTYTTPTGDTVPWTNRETYLFGELPADVPGITPIVKLTLHYEPLTAGCLPTGVYLTVKGLARLSSTNVTSADVGPVVDAGPDCQSGPLAIKVIDMMALRPGGGSWTVADLQGGSRAQFGMELARLTGPNGGGSSDSKLWLEVEYQSIAPNFDAARDTGSRIERLRRRLAYTFTIGVPLWLLDCELLDDVMVSYLAADDPKGEGWLSEAWRRGWLSILGIEVNRNTNELDLKLFFMRDFVCLHWDTMVSEATSGLYGQGAARLGLGQVRTFTRASGAWVAEVAVGAAGLTRASTKGGLYFLAVDGTEKITSAGTIIMSTRTNKLLHSSYIQGTIPAATGHTFEGTGGGNTVACEEIPAGILSLFERAVGARRVKIVKGTAAEVQDRNNTVMSVGAVTGWASFGHLDLDASKPEQWAARKVITGGSIPGTYWWNNAGQTWGAAGGAKVWNLLTGSALQPIVDRYKIPIGSLGGGTATLELMMGVDAAASNRTVYSYHAEWVEGAYLSDELIVTTTVAYTVATDQLSDANDSGTPAESSRIMPASGFTWGVEAKTFWNPSDLAPGEKRVLLAMEADANNSIVIYYDKDTARVKAVYTQAGTPLTASVAVTIVKGTWFRFALRITSAAGEEESTPYSMTVFADGLAGTVQATVTPITLPSTAMLKRGYQGAGTNAWDGMLRNWEILPEVLADVEIQGRP
jgi:hypothetical protein